MDINFERLVSLFITKLKYMLLVAVIAAAATYVVCNNFIEKKYTSSATIAIIPNSEDSNNNNTELNAAIKAVDNYITALRTNTFFKNVADRVNEEFNTDYTAKQLKNDSSFVTSSSDNNSFFNVSYTSSDQKRASDILNIITEEVLKYTDSNSLLFPQRVTVSEEPTFPTFPSSPRTRNNAIYAFIIGFAISLAYFYLREIFDNRIKNVRDISDEYDLPILGVIPDYSELKKKSKSKSQSYVNSYSKEETKNG